MRTRAFLCITASVIVLGFAFVHNAHAQGVNAGPQLKSIFEPVNYKQDLQLLDVFFVSGEEGWVSGVKGTILHSVDGGKTWTPQLGGDPQGQGPNITRLFFLDRTHGWAETGDQLFRTTDGENWQQVGSDVRGEVVFTNPTQGFRGYGGKIYQTLDGGATWKEIYTCGGQVSVQGLAKQFTCDVAAMHFATPRVGYAVGGNNAVLGGGVVVKTEDGGATWRVIFIPQESGDQRTSTVFFLDESHGFVLRNSSGMFRTNDGGNSWQGVAATIPGGDHVVKFADPGVGWSLVQLPANLTTAALTYTTDGGSHWLSRSLNFPAPVSGFSLPRRDTAYVVGDHGMVYRYRVVPVAYSVPNMIGAPQMSGFDSPLNGEVAALKSAVNVLGTQMQSSLGIPVGNTSAPGVSATSPVQAGGFQQDTTTVSNTGTSGQGGFQQTAGGTTQGGGVVSSCCGASLQNLVMASNTLATDLPMYLGRFRNLNLILGGLRFVDNLLQQGNSLRLAVESLRQAKDNQSAAAAYSALSVQANALPPEVNGGFVQDTSAFPSSPTVPGGLTLLPQSGNVNANTGQTPSASQIPPTQATGTPQQGSTQPPKGAQPSNNNQGGVGDAINKAKQKLKIPF